MNLHWRDDGSKWRCTPLPCSWYIYLVHDSFSWRSDYKCPWWSWGTGNISEKNWSLFRNLLAWTGDWTKAFSLTINIWSCDFPWMCLEKGTEKQTNKHSSFMRRSWKVQLEIKLREKGILSESRHNWDIICNWAVNTWVIPSKPETPCGSLTQKWRHL